MANPTEPSPPSEPRNGDSAFLPVVIAAGIALLAILAIAVLILHNKGTKLTPKAPNPHPTSLSQPSVVTARHG
jgi:hypothetical protein